MGEEMDRNPWLWGALVAVAVIVAAVAIYAASGPARGTQQTTTVVQRPADDGSDAPLVTRPPGAAPMITGASPRRASTAGSPNVRRPAGPTPNHGKPAATRSVTPSTRRTGEASQDDTSDDSTDADTSTPADDTENPDATAAAPSAPVPSATGVAPMVRFQGVSWRATSTVTYENPEQDLREIGMTDDGAPIFVRADATQPYRAFLVPVPDGDRQFVEFRRQ